MNVFIKKPLRRASYIVIGVLTLVVISSIAFAVSPIRDLLFSAGQENAALQTDEGDKIVATVNGEPIMQSTIARSRILSQAVIESNRLLLEQQTFLTEEELAAAHKQLAAPSEEEVLQKSIRLRVCLQEAAKLGIEITDAQVDAYFENMEKVKQMADPETLKFAEGAIQAYCDGLGLTREEYHHLYEFEGIRDQLAIERLNEQFLSTLPDNTDATPLLAAYLEELVAKADVKILLD